MHIIHDKNKLRVHYFKSKTKRIDPGGVTIMRPRLGRLF